MNRRVAGCLLILAALIGGLTVSVLVRVGTPGIAARSALPPPPAAGACVVRSQPAALATPSESVSPVGSSSGSAVVRVVGCNQPHDAEVSASWAGMSVASANSAPADLYQACQDQTGQYLDTKSGSQVPTLASGTWGVPPVPFVVQVAHGPSGVLVRGWSWQACLVSPIVPRIFLTGYTGRLADLRLSTPTPPNLRVCYFKNSSIRSGTSCDLEHFGETFASQRIRIDGVDGVGLIQRDSDPLKMAECAAIAQTATGVEDPTFGGRLTLVVDLNRIGDGGVNVPTGRADNAEEISQTYALFQASCSLEATGTRRVYGSIVGVGLGPLPLH